jgi:hypothetical protein
MSGVDKDFWISVLRRIDEGTEQEIQDLKAEILQALDEGKFTPRGSVREDARRLVRLIEEELLSRRLRAERRTQRR